MRGGEFPLHHPLPVGVVHGATGEGDALQGQPTFGEKLQQGFSPLICFFCCKLLGKYTCTPVYRVVRKNIDMVMKGAIFSFGII